MLNSKRRIRKDILAKRISLSEKVIKEKSDMIVKRIIAEFKLDEQFGMFIPIKNEVDLTDLLSYDVALPKIDGDMTFNKYDGNLVKAKFGLSEPTGKEVKVKLILVPGAVFDKSGFRVGYGGGYFDKYLTNEIKVGVCFDFQVVDKVPTEDHDQRMDFLVTESKIYRW